jgi:hypothetical protein
MQRKFLGINYVDFNVTGQLLIIYFAFVSYLGKNWNTTKQCISSSSKLRREVLYNILIEFGISMKQVRLIKMSLTGMCSRVQVGKNLS